MFQTTIEKAKVKFNNKYDYTKIIGSKVTDKVVIGCPIHGEFTQELRVHLRSTSGCPKCSIQNSTMKQRKSLETFIKQANSKHKGKYDYSKTAYINDATKIIITCPIHGDFEQQAGSHIGKQACGCPKCRNELLASSQKLTVEQLKNTIKLPEHISVDLLTYKNTKTKLSCVCKYHGKFEQLLEVLKDGKGICPKCAKQLRGWNRSLYKDSPTILYVLQLTNNTYKVGITKASSIEHRYTKQDRSYIKSVLFQATFLKGTDAWDLEKQVLRTFASYKYQGPQIFIDTGIAEILTENPYSYIQSYLKAHND